MRSLQFDPIHGNPPRWVQAAFYICTLSLLVQAVLALFGTSTQDAVVHWGFAGVFSALRFATLCHAKVWLWVNRLIRVLFLFGRVAVCRWRLCESTANQKAARDGRARERESGEEEQMNSQCRQRSPPDGGGSYLGGRVPWGRVRKISGRGQELRKRDLEIIKRS